MKIKIYTGDYREYVEFPIVDIKYSLDENNIPVDIFISGDAATLELIGEHSMIGFNMKALEEGEYSELYRISKGATHECLCARLPKFEVLEANHVSFS